jgi:hypothetical protein
MVGIFQSLLSYCGIVTVDWMWSQIPSITKKMVKKIISNKIIMNNTKICAAGDERVLDRSKRSSFGAKLENVYQKFNVSAFLSFRFKAKF